ncbi:MAG: T9SS type A sorting domain-containing protein [Bacteroidales bacterium]|nr:T9SS type A sorting domain-containing protein [Bacteroidales bacterium]
MKKYFILIIGIFIPFFATSQDWIYYIDNSLRDYLFDTGSFWVYEKADSTNVIDSLVQTDLVHGIFVVPPGDMNIEYYHALYDSKTLNYQTWDEYHHTLIFKEGVAWQFDGQCIFISRYEIGDNSHGAEIIDTLNTFVLNNFEFNHVTKMLIMNNEFENDNPTIYYYARGVGMIRKEVFSDDTTHLQEVWNIKNWQVNPIVSSIEELEIVNKISAFPNPTERYIHLSLKQDDIFSKLTLYDFMGKNVYESRILNKEIDLDLSNYFNGIYIIVIDGKSMRKSLIIHKY